jgi:plasmid rolling circle replication initiator protein Rep
LQQDKFRNLNVKSQYRVSRSAGKQRESRSTNNGSGQVLAVPVFISGSALAGKSALLRQVQLEGQLEAQSVGQKRSILDNGVQVAKSSDRLRRLTEKKRINEKTAYLLFNANLKPMSKRVASCSTVIERYEFDDGSDLFHSREYCSNRFCAICAERRSRRMVRKYAPVVRQFSKEKYGQHVVLTFPSCETLPARSFIGRKLRNLFRRKLWEKYGGIAGGLYSVESTIDKDGLFHPHVHCLIFTNLPVPCYSKNKQGQQFWPTQTNQELADEWSKVMKGTAFIVRGQKWDGKVFEMLKYMIKQTELQRMTEEQVQHFVEWTAGARVVSAFGGLYGLLPEVIEDDALDMEGEEVEVGKRKLVRKTILELDEVLGCYVPIAVEEYGDSP